MFFPSALENPGFEGPRFDATARTARKLFRSEGRARELRDKGLTWCRARQTENSKEHPEEATMRGKRSVLILLLGVAIALGLAPTMAHAITFHHIDSTSAWISTSGGTPAAWFNLDLPDWYDPEEVTLFEITLTGHGDNSSSPIDLFLSFDDGQSYTQMASYDVGEYQDFTLTLDILNGDLLYNGTDVGDLPEYFSEKIPLLASFEGYDHFSIGYGCHFWHDASEVTIEQPTPTPEPGTLLLLGTGLLGLAGSRKRTGEAIA